MNSTKTSPIRVRSKPSKEDPEIRLGMLVGDTKNGKRHLVVWDFSSRARSVDKDSVETVEPIPYQPAPPTYQK